MERAEHQDDELADLIRVDAATGVRLGEILALRWLDLSLPGRYAHVAAAITDGGPGVGVIRKETKRSDWRDVPLTDGAVSAPERQLARRRAILGRDPAPEEYVFPGSADGTRPHRPDSMGDRLAEVRGTAPTTFLHLRHFAATTMRDAGEEYRTVAEILGNSETTLRLHYDGRTNVDKRRAVAALELD